MNLSTISFLLALYSSSSLIYYALPKSDIKLDISYMNKVGIEVEVNNDNDSHKSEIHNVPDDRSSSLASSLTRSHSFPSTHRRKPILYLRKSWSTGFAVAVKALRTTAYSMPNDVNLIRRLTDHAIPTWLPTLPRGVCCKPSKEPPGEWVFPKSLRGTFIEPSLVPEVPRNGASEGLYILYMHGGAFCVCNTGTHRGIQFRLVAATGARIFAVDYRRPPEFPFPIPLDDCLAAYKFLLRTVNSSNIVFMGDSAGGGLVVSTMLAARDEGLPLPAAAVLLSPWVDLADNSTDSWERNKDYDYIPQPLAKFFAESYRGSATWEAVSPACVTDLSRLPPLLIECGELEVLADQIIQFAAKCIAAGIDVELNVRDDMVHVFQLFSFTDMPQCVQSFETMAKFCAKAVPNPPVPESMSYR